MVVGGRVLPAGSGPVVVGVLNVSPESPNRDTVVRGPASAVARARHLAGEGAAIVDVGGRSSNFAARDAGWRAELRRVVPVVEALKVDGHVVSVDTWDARVIGAAARAGADLVNDAEGLQDPAVIAAVAEAGLPVVVPFVDGPDPRHQRPIDRVDPVAAIFPRLRAALERAAAAGIGQVLLDPGTGFARRELDHAAHDQLQRRVHGELGRLRALGRPLFVALPRRAQRPESLPLARQLVAVGAEFIRAHDPSVVVEAAAERRR